MQKIFQLVFTFLVGTVLSAGAQNIGIGTNSPLMKLHISSGEAGGLLIENTQTLNTEVNNSLVFKIGDGQYKYTGAIKTIGQGANAARIGFFTYAAFTAEELLERMSITDAGNVGIGLINPTNKLSVQGNANITGSLGLGTIIPASSALLDLSSTTKGFLPPRMDSAARNAIAAPVAGLILWCTNCGPSGSLQIHNGSAWMAIGSVNSTPQKPSIVTTNVTGVTGSSAVSGGNVVAEGSSAVTSRGICWDTAPVPGIGGDHSIDGAGPGSFVSNMANLLPGTIYFVRAYAVNNSAGIEYGNEVGFQTQTVKPTVITSGISSITSYSATGGGNVTADGADPVTARGICWSTSPLPTIANSKTNDGTGTGSFASSLTGLQYSTLYHVRAYATNAVGTAYGNDTTFTTSSAVLPTVTTTAISDIHGTSAASGGNVSSAGGGQVNARGVCWSTNPTPTISNSKTVDGTGTGSYSSQLTNLVLGNTYYVRAYATNDVGTGYGAQLNFTTALGIGDNYQGGKIAYIFNPGDPGYVSGESHGLIVTVNDYTSTQGNGWGCQGSTITGADGRALGTGKQNTIDIIAGCATAGIAARVCGDLVLNGYSDWFLPSEIELTAIMFNGGAIGGFTQDYYWTSSEYSSTHAYRLFYVNNYGNTGNSFKDYGWKFRPVRQF